MLTGFREFFTLLVTSAVFKTIATPTPCPQSLFVNQNEHVRLDVIGRNVSRQQAHHSCTVQLQTRHALRLVMNVTYIPHLDVARGHNCTLDCLHVGNDNLAIGQEMMTSYKVCQEARGVEIVSRYSYLWVVSRFSLPPQFLELDVTAEPPAECGPGEMQCSPVQCVSRERVCDGRWDCRNGQDEYCFRLNQDDETPGCKIFQRNPGSEWETPPEGSTCFRCGDGTCVQPKAARYVPEWSVPLWFLCDGVKHCLDGWDERKDVCYRARGRRDSVFECVPSDLPPSVNMSVLLWRVLRCDGRKHCRDGADEIGCKDKPAEVGLSEQLHFDPITFCVVTVLVITVCGAFLLIIRRGRQNVTCVTSEDRSSKNASCEETDDEDRNKAAEVVWLSSEVMEKDAKISQERIGPVTAV